MGCMLSNDSSVGLLRHDKSKKVFTNLIVSVRLKLNRCVFRGRRSNVVTSDRRGLSTPNRHSGERRQRGTERKQDFGFFSHVAPHRLPKMQPYNLRQQGVHLSSGALLGKFEGFFESDAALASIYEQ